MQFARYLLPIAVAMMFVAPASTNMVEVGTNDFMISNFGPPGDTSPEAEHPAVAYNSIADEYFVAWRGDDYTYSALGDEEFEIWGRRVDADGTLLAAYQRCSFMGPDGDNSYNAEDPDIVFNATNNEYFMVWEANHAFAGLNPDKVEIWGQRMAGANATQIGGHFRISFMGPNTSYSYYAADPAVAYNSTNNEYLVVWRGRDDTAPNTDLWAIYGQRVSAGGVLVGGNFRISFMGPVAYESYAPDLAYYPTGNEYLAVWFGDTDAGALVDGEFEIWGQRLAGASGALSGTNFRISHAGTDGDQFVDALRPKVAANTTQGEYLVVWDDTRLEEDDYDIWGQLIAAGTGAEIGSDFRISQAEPDFAPGAFAHAISPDVTFDSLAGEYLVTWNGTTTALFQWEDEIFGQRLDASGNEIGADDFRISDIGPDQTPSSAVGYDAAVTFAATPGEYLVIWTGIDTTWEKEVYGQRIGPGGPFVLDRWGGVHRGATAGELTPGTPYFGFDVARNIEFVSNGYYVLDGWGGVHAGGGAPPLTGAPYFGFDAGVDIEVAPTRGLYVLDGFGGVHAIGGATPMTPATPYFGFHIARDMELDDAGGYWTLDGFGGVHSGAGATSIAPDTVYFGSDIARDLELASGGGYYLLDGFGGVHAGDGAPTITPATYYFGVDVAKDIELFDGGYYVLDSFGGVHAGGPATAFSPPPPYFNLDAAGDLEIR